MKNLTISLKLFAIMTLLPGVVYPLIITGYAHLVVKNKSQGSLIRKNDQYIGSELIAQNFKEKSYFWSRPSAVDFNTLSSGGSNLSVTSTDFKIKTDDRIKELKEVNLQKDQAPADLIFSSGSGLDPHISLESAYYQSNRIASVRNLEINRVHKLIKELTETADYAIFGEERVNVLKLNLALDSLK